MAQAVFITAVASYNPFGMSAKTSVSAQMLTSGVERVTLGDPCAADA